MLEKIRLKIRNLIDFFGQKEDENIETSIQNDIYEQWLNEEYKRNFKTRIEEFKNILTLTNYKKQSNIIRYKCQVCSLEYYVLTWDYQWPLKYRSFCPECGKQYSLPDSIKQLEAPICFLNIN